MDFNDTPEEAAFRKEVRAWLDANATRKSDDRQSFRARNDDPGAAEEGQGVAGQEGRRRLCAHHLAEGVRRPRRLADPAGDLPAGGSELPGAARLLRYRARHVHPDHDGLCARPSISKRYVKPALHGEEVWCQLFSEPAAGSDVAGIRTRAERDGDEWVINGQKVWTSGAHYCDYGIIITRTDPNVPEARRASRCSSCR